MWKPLWKNKKFVIRPELCIGCRSCELACAYKHTGMVDLSSAAISVYQFKETSVIIPMLCMQCDEPECLKACKNQAISKCDISGVVTIDDTRCIKCNSCMHACLLGNIHSSISLGSPIKCDQCGGDPQCQKFCPVGAVDLVDSDDFVTEELPILTFKSPTSLPEAK